MWELSVYVDSWHNHEDGDNDYDNAYDELGWDITDFTGIGNA